MKPKPTKMEYDKFIKLMKELQPSEKLSEIECAIWYILKDNWNMAHKTVQNLSTESACWLHAYLHRVEGDIGNANYWYKKVHKKPTIQPLESELNEIIKLVFL